MRNMLNIAKILVIHLVCLGIAEAALLSVGPQAFSGGSTLIDFNNIQQHEEVRQQYVGVSITGGLYGDQINGIIFTNPGASLVVNYDPNVGCDPEGVASLPLCNTITLNFSAPITRLGMFVVTGDNDDFRISSAGESVDFATPPLTVPASTDFFVGVQNMAGFTTVTLQGVRPGAGFAIDNLRYDVALTPAGEVPEPETFALMGGAAGLFALRWVSNRLKRRKLLAAGE